MSLLHHYWAGNVIAAEVKKTNIYDSDKWRMDKIEKDRTYDIYSKPKDHTYIYKQKPFDEILTRKTSEGEHDFDSILDDIIIDKNI